MTLINTYYLNDFYTGLISCVLGGSTFGFIMPAFTYFSDQKLKNKGIDTANISPRQSRKITVNMTISAAIEVSEKDIIYLNRSVIKDKDLTAGTIKAKTKMTWKSFG